MTDRGTDGILKQSVSIVLPAKDERTGIITTMPVLLRTFPNAEVIVVDDGSVDDTAATAEKLGAKVIRHRRSLGNGAAIKTGIRAATGDVLVMMDADGQHQPSDIHKLLSEIAAGADMAVGARTSKQHASFGRLLANSFYNRFASWVTDQKVLDLTSGFRACRRAHAIKYLHLLPNGFSYPTTITMAFMREGLQVQYVPVDVQERLGKSHIRPIKDGTRFLMIIFKVGTLFSPMKIFMPFAFAFFAAASARYLYTYLEAGRFTNMSALLFVNSVVIFLIGLISEQINALLYSAAPSVVLDSDPAVEKHD